MSDSQIRTLTALVLGILVIGITASQYTLHELNKRVGLVNATTLKIHKQVDALQKQQAITSYGLAKVHGKEDEFKYITEALHELLESQKAPTSE